MHLKGLGLGLVIGAPSYLSFNLVAERLIMDKLIRESLLFGVPILALVADAIHTRVTSNPVLVLDFYIFSFL